MEFEADVPQLAQQSRGNYYIWLTSRGMSHREAYDTAVNKFGPPKTQAEIEEDKAKAAQIGGLAQVAGSLGGLYAAQQIPSLFSTAAPTSTTLTKGALAAPKIVGVKAVGAGGAQAGATTGASTLSSIGSVALPVAAVAATVNNAWETGMKDIVRGRGDRADWTNQAANMALGAGPNIALRLLGKPSIGAMMKSGKSQPQQIRDDFRGDLKESGVVDDSYHVTLADGTKFNVGLDGKTKYTNADGKTKRNAWDGDSSNPLSNFATQQLDPMIRKIYGADNPKAKYFPSQFTGMLVNAAISNAKSEQDVMANIQTMLGKSKFAEQAGVGVKPPPPAKAPKGQVVRVSPGMYVNDKGHVGPAKTVREALESNYNKSKGKEKK